MNQQIAHGAPDPSPGLSQPATIARAHAGNPPAQKYLNSALSSRDDIIETIVVIRKHGKSFFTPNTVTPPRIAGESATR